MPYFILAFVIAAVAAGLLGFSGVASSTAGLAQVLFFLFVGLLAVSALMGGGRQR
jgi:uncharacterized membrane protein YtjA (UPF0391 family)